MESNSWEFGLEEKLDELFTGCEVFTPPRTNPYKMYVITVKESK